jgi:CTP synthase
LEVAIVGKYVQLGDAYLSVVAALEHASIALDSDILPRWVNAEDVEAEGAAKHLRGASGIVVPGGFGARGVDGKVKAIGYARQERVPFLGLCLGMQCSIIEWARDIAHLEGANSVEFDENTPHPVINLLPEQEDVVLYPCRLTPDTLTFSLYGQEVVYERHRHRYEFNNAYRSLFLETGYAIAGTSPDGRLVEIVELPGHPFFIATQFHPEFRSRPNHAHPLFLGFIEACSRFPSGSRPVAVESDALVNR